MSKNQYQSSWYRRIDWPVTLFLILNPLLTIIVLPFYFYEHGFSLSFFLLGALMAAATNLAITAGYHRLFAHRSFEAHPLIRFLFLWIGASAFQGSALKWSSDHRRHHWKVDTEEDPYSIKKGFWYAHMGWMFLRESVDLPIKAADLEKDRLVAHQHRHYVAWAIASGFFAPALIGWMLGSFWGGFWILGALRIVLTQQSTFFVNSLCHTLGQQTYSDKISARDSLLVAFLTHGEGYHNFHHTFQSDYRNGIRWYQWDPTKWTIWTLSILGLTKKLKTISSHEILKARLHMEELRLKRKGICHERIDQLRNRVLSAQASFKRLHDDYDQMKKNLETASQQKVQQLRIDLEVAKLEFQNSLQQWKTMYQLSLNGL